MEVLAGERYLGRRTDAERVGLGQLVQKELGPAGAVGQAELNTPRGWG